MRNTHLYMLSVAGFYAVAVNAFLVAFSSPVNKIKHNNSDYAIKHRKGVIHVP